MAMPKCPGCGSNTHVSLIGAYYPGSIYGPSFACFGSYCLRLCFTDTSPEAYEVSDQWRAQSRANAERMKEQP